MYRVETMLGRGEVATVQTVSPDMPLRDAVARLEEQGCCSLLVVDSGAIVGILTEHDVIHAIGERGDDPSTISVSEAMSRRIARASVDFAIEQAFDMMNESEIEHLIVYSGDVVVGMISRADVIEWVLLEREKQIDDLLGYITRG